MIGSRICELYSKRRVSNASEAQNVLIYALFTSNCHQLVAREDYIADLIFSSKLETKHQLRLAQSFFEKQAETIFDENEFFSHCGIGSSKPNIEEISICVKNFLLENTDLIEQCKGKITHPNILKALKEVFPLVDPAQLMSEILKLSAELSKETRLDDRRLDKEPQSTNRLSKIDKNVNQDRQSFKEFEQNEANSKFQVVKLDKLAARELAEAINSEEQLEKHHKVTQGKIITRFPPEPNGILHIGHARAIRFNFSIAGIYEGLCNLRYDDTNPEKEKKEYMDMIEENVRWMGFTPSKVLHASHYFMKIYEYTIELIRLGKAFVCHLSQTEQRTLREQGLPSPYRDRTVEENLEEFKKMTRGFYGEGEAVLRAKIDPKSENMTLRDPVLYRVLFTPHPVTGKEWCIYPMYDYAHPLSDSIENITHSCCTLEFETRRELYYWPLNQLNLYKPFVWEFSRLNVTYTITSKRKIQRLIEDK